MKYKPFTKEVLENKQEFDAFIEGNQKLVGYIITKMNLGYNEDYFQIGTIGLIKATQTFKIDKKINFATYASRCITNEILMDMRHNKKHNNLASLNELISITNEDSVPLLELIPSKVNIEEEVVNKISTLEFHNNFEKFINSLNTTKQEILKLKMKGLNQREIGEKTNLSQSYICRVLKDLKVKFMKERNKKMNEKEQVNLVKKWFLEHPNEIFKAEILSNNGLSVKEITKVKYIAINELVTEGYNMIKCGRYLWKLSTDKKDIEKQDEVIKEENTIKETTNLIKEEVKEETKELNSNILSEWHVNKGGDIEDGEALCNILKNHIELAKLLDCHIDINISVILS